MPEGCLFPVGFILQIQISDLTCRHSRVTVWHRRSPSEHGKAATWRAINRIPTSKPHEASVPQPHSNEANIDNWHRRYANSLWLLNKQAEVLLFSEVCAIGEMVATQNMCVPLGWRRLQRANERARYIHENQAQHALMWLHKWLFLLLMMWALTLRNSRAKTLIMRDK